MIALAGVVALVWAGLLTRAPRAAFVLFLIVMVTVPAWGEVDLAGVQVQPLTLTAAFIGLTLVTLVDKRLTGADVLLGVFLFVSILAVQFFGTPRSAVQTIILVWVPAYLIGRYFTPKVGRDFIYRSIAVAGTFVAGWAIVEFLFGVHIYENFVGTGQTGFFGWNVVQIRGVWERSEGAFGHSIALGAFLVLVVPFVVAAPYTVRARLMMIAAIGGGVLVSGSRAAWVGLPIVLIASLWMPTVGAVSPRFRRGLLGVTVVGALLAIPVMRGVLANAGAELQDSTRYRSNLTDTVFQDIVPFGPARWFTEAAGFVTYRGNRSIDNEFLLLVIQFGWVPVLILLAGLAVVIWRVLRRQANPAEVAIVGQVFILYTVAFITQYPMAFWMVVGIAVGLRVLEKDEARGDDPASPTRRRPLPARPSVAGCPSTEAPAARQGTN